MSPSHDIAQREWMLGRDEPAFSRYVASETSREWPHRKDCQRSKNGQYNDTPMYDTMCRARNRAQLSRVRVKGAKLRDKSASRGVGRVYFEGVKGLDEGRLLLDSEWPWFEISFQGLRCLNTGIGFTNMKIFALLFCLPADDEKDRKLWKDKKGYKKPPEKTAKGQKTKKSLVGLCSHCPLAVTRGTFDLFLGGLGSPGINAAVQRGCVFQWNARYVGHSII
ncbi:hypothetical protein B0H13DRAFT_2286892 [Mycena leptocephala]|nr:hypothetical protein B0H13DRAFT_2286892 [Mycena leptocephala]